MANPTGTDKIIEALELLLNAEKWTPKLEMIFGNQIDDENCCWVYSQYVLRGQEIQKIVESNLKLMPGEHYLTRILNHHIGLLLESKFLGFDRKQPGHMFTIYTVRQSYLIQAIIEKVLKSNPQHRFTAILAIAELFPTNTLRQLEDDNAYSAFKRKTISESHFFKVISLWISSVARHANDMVTSDSKQESPYSSEDLIRYISRTISGFSDSQLEECSALLLGQQHDCLEGLSLLLLTDNEYLLPACCDVHHTAPWHNRLLRLTTGLSTFCSKIQYKPDFTNHLNLVKFYSYHLLTFPHPSFRTFETFDAAQADLFLRSCGIQSITMKEWRDWNASEQAKEYIFRSLRLCSSDPEECSKIIRVLDRIDFPFSSKLFQTFFISR